MHLHTTRTLLALVAAAVLGGLACWSGLSVRADDVQLDSGLFLRGQAFPVAGLDLRTSKRNLNKPIPAEPYYVLDDGVRRYFFPKKQGRVESKDELSGVPEFKFPRTPRSRTLTPEVIGAATIDNWEHGRRTVTLRTKRGPVEIVEEITRLRPDFAVVEGVTHDWAHGIDTRLIPADQLRELLQRSIDPKNLNDRKTVIRFYLDAEMYAEASRELEELMKDFPEQQEWGQMQLPIISEQNFRKGMREVLRRQAAGQHLLAYEIAKKAPPDQVSVEVQRQAEELVDHYQLAIDQRERALVLLEQLEATLPPAVAQSLMSFRLALRDELSIGVVDRLDPFLRAEQDANLTAEQKLALAYSAWVVGPSYADVDLNVAKNLWQARFLASEYIRANENAVRRDELAEQITALEGVSVERLAQLIPLLPYPFEENPPLPGQPREYVVPIAEQEQLPSTYQVCLPLEYHPQHRYPLIVALRRSGQTLEQTIRWWAGDSEEPGAAMRRGYIVIAPEFADSKTDDFDYSVQAHRQILTAIDDVRKKFSVDSDRIFVAGHELGGDACYDIALSHPDIFAGAIPFLAQPDKYCVRMWRNGLRQSWYIVTGEKDRETLAHNASIVNNLAKSSKAGDIIYCEYKSRGFESYHEELPRLFDWMDGRRRLPLADVKGGWEADIMRPTENRFFWVEITKPSPLVLDTIVWEKPKTIRSPLEVSSKITAMGNSIYVTNPGGAAKIWLSPEMIDFQARVQVTIYGKQKFNNFVRPSAAALLEDFRIRGDRQRLFLAVLEL